MYTRVLGLVLLSLSMTAAAAFGSSGVVISGGSPAQRRLARDLLATLQPKRLASVTFKQSTHPRYHGQEMDLAGTNPSFQDWWKENGVRDWWDESLFAAAFVRASNTRKIPQPRLVAFGWGAFQPVHGPGPPGPRASRKTVALYLTNLRRAAAAAHAKVLELKSFRLGPIAVAVTLAVGDPAPFLRNRAGRVVKVFDSVPTGIFARYVGVFDSTGTRIWEVANSGPSGAHYVEPDLQGCDPIPPQLLPGQTIPPCPA